MNSDSKIYVAGHNGMAGSAIMRKLNLLGYNNIVTRTSKQLDLRSQTAVKEFFEQEQPAYVFLAAAKVGGIVANNVQRADFLYENLMIECNVIHEAYKAGVQKLLFLGSSCIYPKMAPQPLKEEYLLSGYLEATNEPYAIAKIAGIKLCESYNRQYGCNFISVMPTNLYGPNDNYDLQNSHVLPALIRKIHEAKEQGADKVEIWGSGKPMREFLHVDDLADACVFLMNQYDGSDILNIGSGVDITIADLAITIAKVVGYQGKFVFDTSKPDGTPRKLMDVSSMKAIGWQSTISLEEGLANTYAEFAQKYTSLKGIATN